MFEKLFYDENAYKLLKKCSDAKDMREWNEFRDRNNNAPINLRFTNLRKVNLVGANLSYIDFRGADFEESDFRNSDVKYANISIRYYFKIVLFTLMLVFLINLLINFYILERIKYQETSIITNIIVIILGIGFLYISTIKRGFFSNLGFFISLNFIGILFSFVLIEKYDSFSLICYIFLLSAFFMITIDFQLYTNIQKVISQTKNPTECIGFNSKYLKITKLDIVKQENQQLKDELKEINDEEARKNIEKRITDNEQNIATISQMQTVKESFELKVKNLLEEIKAPYKYLRTHIRIQYGLIVLFLIVILGIIYVSIVYGKIFYDERETMFTALFLDKTKLPDFGTMFGIILYYGIPVLLALVIIVYLFSKINHSLDKIIAYQSKEQRIMELISIIKAKIILEFKDDEEFKNETTKMLDRLQNITFDEYNKELNLSITEPTINLTSFMSDVKDMVKKDITGKDDKK